jgi:hypothetical protein
MAKPIESTVEFIAIVEGTEYTEFHYKDKDKEWNKRLYDAGLINTAKALKIGQSVPLTFEKQGQYWEITKIGGSAPKQAVNAPVKAETDWDTIGRQKARCSLIESAANFHKDREKSTPQDVMLTAKVWEDYVFSPVVKK